MSKSLLLMRDVIFKHHPKFKRNPALKKFGIKNPTAFNVERLIEEALAAEGGYDRIDAAHADFSDRSDSKTCSINPKLYGKWRNIYHGNLGGVVSGRSKKKKDGALRCTIYNPIGQTLMYYYLPKRFWHKLPVTASGSISFKYNSINHTIPYFEKYRVESFRALARAKG